MNRPFARTLARLIALTAALALATGCDDGDSGTTPPATDAGTPDAGPDPVVPDTTVTLDPAARSCELMLRGSALTVVFGDAVEGRHLRRGEQLAVAFAHRADAPIPAGAVAFADGEGAEVESATCFDATGRPLPDVEIALSGL